METESAPGSPPADTNRTGQVSSGRRRARRLREAKVGALRGAAFGFLPGFVVGAFQADVSWLRMPLWIVVGIAVGAGTGALLALRRPY